MHMPGLRLRQLGRLLRVDTMVTDDLGELMFLIFLPGHTGDAIRAGPDLVPCIGNWGSLTLKSRLGSRERVMGYYVLSLVGRFWYLPYSDGKLSGHLAF